MVIPLLLEFPQHLPELLARYGVHARGRFVEVEDVGLVDEGAAEREFLFHASGEFSRPSLAERFEKFVDALHEVVILPDGRPEYRGEEREILLDGEVLIEREASGHIADAFAKLLVVPHHVEPVYRCGAAVGQYQGGDDAEEGGFPGAVGSDDTEQLSLLHLEAHPVQGDGLPVPLGDIFDAYRSHGLTV